MWYIVLFDLPVGSKTERKEYTNFRKALIREGFSQLQFSVYARFCESMKNAKSFGARLKPLIPKGGQVRFLPVTDIQFGKMEIYWGRKKSAVEKKPAQLMMF
jgi:CRISPR-associated protein Cas2